MNKFICATTALLAVSTLSYAQQKSSCAPTPPTPCCFEQGHEICNDKTPAAYNASARIDVQCSWDVFVTGSFIYWHVDQDAMDIAYPLYEDESSDKIFVQNFDYKPGFKVGIGANFGHDQWVGLLEYTWLHQSTTGSKTAFDDTAWEMTSWMAITQTSPAKDYDRVEGKWHANFDILDATLSRPFYQGRYLTILPFGGLRGAWIRQNLKIEADNSSYVNISHNHSRCWAVGPRVGFQAHWLLGCGFRFEGGASASALFTRYTKVTNNCSSNGATYSYMAFKDYNTVRAMADIGVGLGWGSYFDRQNYHFDLLAAYDFNILWNQNMMREVCNIRTYYGTSSSAGDLHLHGLTATARFDF